MNRKTATRPKCHEPTLLGCRGSSTPSNLHQSNREMCTAKRKKILPRPQECNRPGTKSSMPISTYRDFFEAAEDFFRPPPSSTSFFRIFPDISGSFRPPPSRRLPSHTSRFPLRIDFQPSRLPKPWPNISGFKRSPRLHRAKNHRREDG